MKTHDEIHDMIQTCDTYPNAASVPRILNILEHLNNRISHLEAENERQRKDMKAWIESLNIV